MHSRLRDVPKRCRTCDWDITLHARCNRWTQCSVCYWKEQFERCTPIQEIQRLRAEGTKRLPLLEAEVEELKAQIASYEQQLQTNTPWWKRLLSEPTDEKLTSEKARYSALLRELSSVRRQVEGATSAIERTRKAHKRFTEAQAGRAAAERQARTKQAQHEEYSSASGKALLVEFDRTLFLIQPKDYRRGNVIDNYFRNKLEDKVLDAFGRQCVFCTADADLTFDHYGMTKNEGGNFVLLARDGTALKLNLVVLCRSCNSMKSQKPHGDFFTQDHQNRILNHHTKLLECLVADAHFMKVIQKWSKPQK